MVTVMKSGGDTFHGTGNSSGEWNTLQATNVPASQSSLAGNRRQLQILNRVERPV
jgi:hypothetical protein